LRERERELLQPLDSPPDAASRTVATDTAVLPVPVPATEIDVDPAAVQQARPATVEVPAAAPSLAPSSRRQARAAREDESRPAVGRRSAHPAAATGRASLQTAAIPIVKTKRGVSRHLAAKSMGALVMVMVALIAVATSTPANALLSAADVQAAAAGVSTVGSTTSASGDVQSVRVTDGVGNEAVQRDGYDTATIAQVAAAQGIRPEATFTNDPNGTVQWPFRVGVHIGDRFGFRDCAGCSADHHGQDFAPGLGADIQAIADGVVSYAEDGDGDLGVHLMINHVINGQVVTSVYAHMIHGSMRFKVGDVVKVGDIVGKTGTTGMSTGPHLHFEIRIGGITGQWVDPLVWLYANTN